MVSKIFQIFFVNSAYYYKKTSLNSITEFQERFILSFQLMLLSLRMKLGLLNNRYQYRLPCVGSVNVVQ